MDSFTRRPGQEAINPDLAIKAAQQTIAQAGQERKHAAVAGGLAMQIFGFTRATRDVDVVASDSLTLDAVRPLEFGGHVYAVRVGNENIEVDWIVRSDEKRPVYEAALQDAKMTEYGFPIIVPEWMVILKYLAGRGKDHMDLLWLLQQPGLVTRETVIAKVEALMGPMAFWAKQDLESVFMEADFMNEKGKS